MAHAIQQPKFTSPIKFQKFSKYDFVESFVSVAKNEKVKEEEREKIQAAMIADAIEETQTGLLESLATKEDLKALELSAKRDLELGLKSLERDIKTLEYKLMIKGGIFLTVLITFAPKLWKFLEMGGF